jgi:hypothetical protein
VTALSKLQMLALTFQDMRKPWRGGSIEELVRNQRLMTSRRARPALERPLLLPHVEGTTMNVPPSNARPTISGADVMFLLSLAIVFLAMVVTIVVIRP